jgi:dihydropteroate synthase
MGILNLTPDSFSDGGRHAGRETGLNHALRMVEQGADIIDVGGESTRPGSQSVPAEEQMCRVLDVIRALGERLPEGLPISIDTTSSKVAEAALDAGASWINDTAAGRDSPDMFPLAAERGVPIVLMHRQGTPATMQDSPSYRDVIGEVSGFLAARAEAALDAGIDPDHILLDPGIGFGKRRADNLALLGGLPRLAELGYRLLLGTSRKRFMGSICGQSKPSMLMPATCATTAIGVMAGVSVFRVHDVAANRQAADVAYAVYKMSDACSMYSQPESV